MSAEHLITPFHERYNDALLQHTKKSQPMTPERKRIVIAEACGWKRNKENAFSEPLWEKGRMEALGAHELPDYLHDLNAMHEAEKVLTDDDSETGSRWRYIQELIEITKAESMEVHREVFVVATATAGQRADAFLLTIGKMEGGE